ncbi:MAG TPA: glycosyltransferase [Candidatus Saccharimonadales bacterium]|nr:glycosyltransferase [Candidatus Saccharimonadales bacterium]
MIAENMPIADGSDISRMENKLFSDQPEKLKILWANESSVISGPVNKLMHTAPLLTEAEHELTILLPDYDETVHGSLGGARIIETGYLPIENFQLSILKPALSFKNMLAEGEYDVVHVATPMRGPFGLFFLGGSVIDMSYDQNMPIVAGAQSFNRLIARSMIPKLFSPAAPIVDSFVKRQESRMHGRATINYSPSIAMDEYILQRKKVSKDTLVRLGNGKDPMFNAERRTASKAIQQRLEWGVEDDELVILVPGRLAAEKSLAKLKDIEDVPGIKIVLVGDGPERQNLQQLLPQAVITGMLRGDELADAYSNGDIMVLTSETESYSQVLFEGLASSLPVVAPNKGAFVQLVDEGVTGFKYESAEELRGLVAMLIANPELRARLGENGRRATEDLNWEDETKRLIRIYRMAIYLNKHPSTSARLARTAIGALGLY